MGDVTKLQIKKSDTKDQVRQSLGVADRKYDHGWGVFEFEIKGKYPDLDLDAQTPWGKMHPVTTKNAVDSIKISCEEQRKDLNDLNDDWFGQLVEWKLWQLHRAATRQSRGGSEAASGGTSGGASGGGSGKQAYDPVRDVD